MRLFFFILIISATLYGVFVIPVLHPEFDMFGYGRDGFYFHKTFCMNGQPIYSGHSETLSLPGIIKQIKEEGGFYCSGSPGSRQQFWLETDVFDQRTFSTKRVRLN